MPVVRGVIRRSSGLRIQVVGRGIHVAEDGSDALPLECVRRRHEREGGDDHLLRHARRTDGDLQGDGAVAGDDAVGRAGELGRAVARTPARTARCW